MRTYFTNGKQDWKNIQIDAFATLTPPLDRRLANEHILDKRQARKYSSEDPENP